MDQLGIVIQALQYNELFLFVATFVDICIETLRGNLWQFMHTCYGIACTIAAEYDYYANSIRSIKLTICQKFVLHVRYAD